tara:strand:- start:360 stop:581 length:222 start_codon:yes stop_codon:yes gene_type:complete
LERKSHPSAPVLDKAEKFDPLKNSVSLKQYRLVVVLARRYISSQGRYEKNTDFKKASPQELYSLFSKTEKNTL